MKAIPHLIRNTVRMAAWLAVLLLLSFALVSCSKGGAGGKPADVDYYTCTMHPSVKKPNPTDKCPICSMDLVPVKKKGSASSPAPGDSQHAGHTEHMPGMPM